MSGSASATPAEQHLGDRLAALVDGELSHDTRERVLAHLATCCRCKAEADAQRRLKSVFAETAPPPPSEGFLARLQGLPGGEDGPGDPPGGDSGSGGFGNGAFGAGPGGFGYLPAIAHPADGPGRAGFRIHDVERSASRGRRFAFAAAGAVSAAAFALSGAQPLDMTVGVPGGGGHRTASSPPRTAPAPGRTGNAPAASPSAGTFRSRGAPASAPGFLGSAVEATAHGMVPAGVGTALPGPPFAHRSAPDATVGSAPPPFSFGDVRLPAKGTQGLSATGERSTMSSAGASQPAGRPVPFAGAESSGPAPFTGH